MTTHPVRFQLGHWSLVISHFSLVLCLSTFCLSTFCLLPSAFPQSPPNPNLLQASGGFEATPVPEDNLWDGVDGDGYLAGFRHGVRVVTDRGGFDTLAMPLSVACVDLDGDGKPDLVTADPTGYFRFYPNRGTAKAPRFGEGELLPIFLSATLNRTCPRFALADWRHAGLLDLLVGDYFGDTFFLPNVGTARQPVFRQPPEGRLDAARLYTSERNHFWGNLLSPAAYDWTGRGQLDVLFGEGTYSANAIHLFENLAASGGVPRFAEARSPLVAHGDGREQLIPTVVDYLGDGNPALLVADRTGEIGVYRRPTRPRPGEDLPRTATLSFGGTTKLPGLVAPFAADFNGDGLFDLVLGLPSGRIAVALNTGTRDAPAFGPLQEIRGEDRLGRNVRLPLNCNVNTHAGDGNALAYGTVVSAADDPAARPPEGTRCLKVGYWPQPPNAVFAIPPEGIPGASKHFTVSFGGLSLEAGKTYALGFKAKQTGMERLAYKLYSHYRGIPSSVKIERDARGAVRNQGTIVDETIELGQKFSAGPDWTTIQAALTPRYTNAALKGETQITCSVEVDFWAASLSSVLYLDDFTLVKQNR